MPVQVANEARRVSLKDLSNRPLDEEGARALMKQPLGAELNVAKLQLAHPAQRRPLTIGMVRTELQLMKRTDCSL